MEVATAKPDYGASPRPTVRVFVSTAVQVGEAARQTSVKVQPTRLGTSVPTGQEQFRTRSHVL